jgi:hypothetical protein
MESGPMPKLPAIVEGIPIGVAGDEDKLQKMQLEDLLFGFFVRMSDGKIYLGDPDIKVGVAYPFENGKVLEKPDVSFSPKEEILYIPEAFWDKFNIPEDFLEKRGQQRKNT